MIATGDNFSLIKLFRCPSVVENSKYKAYGGHSGFVRKVRFTQNDQYLISIGGNDKSVFIWETDFGKSIYNEDENEKKENEEKIKKEEEEDKEERK